MSNYTKVGVAEAPRTELHDVLQLTGAEISVNEMPAGASVPFIHAHKQNEEIYYILSGRGTMSVDTDAVPLAAGDWLRIAPAARRQLSAAPGSPLAYICIQVKAGSLEGYTKTDAVIG